MIVKDIRTNKDIKKIMLHHSVQETAPQGIDSNISYNSAGQFGVPYDIIINSNGTYDLSARWIYGSNASQFSQNVPLTSITKYNNHYLSGIGETYDQTKNFIHIVLSGNFNVTKPTLFQINALVILLNALIQFFQIDPRIDFYYHNDLIRTSCPGVNMPSKWSIISQLNIKFPQLYFTYPTVNLSFDHGSSLQLTWFKQLVPLVNLYYSMDEGNTWITLSLNDRGISFNFIMPEVSVDTPVMFKLMGSKAESVVTIEDAVTPPLSFALKLHEFVFAPSVSFIVRQISLHTHKLNFLSPLSYNIRKISFHTHLFPLLMNASFGIRQIIRKFQSLHILTQVSFAINKLTSRGEVWLEVRSPLSFMVNQIVRKIKNLTISPSLAFTVGKVTLYHKYMTFLSPLTFTITKIS